MDISINWGAVIVAALANVVIGSLWYGPVFGKKWRQLMADNGGLRNSGMTMGKAVGIALVSSVVMANVLAHEQAVWYDALAGASMGLVSFAFQLAFWLWLGFVVTTQLAGVLWEGRSWKLFCFNAIASLVSLFAAALILTAWM